MPKANPEDAALPRVGVKSDATHMSIDDLKAAIESSENAYMDQQWESCYLFADLFRRKDWTIGINVRPKNSHFVHYVQVMFPKRGYTENDLMTRVDCYVTYAPLGDPEVIAMIKQMGSLTKAHMAIPWVVRHKDKVRDILEVCQTTPTVNLRAALRAKFPMKPGALPRQKTRTRGESASADRVVDYFATHEPSVINEELFVPRANATEQEIEYAWYAVVKSFMLKNTTLSIDDVFATMMQSWIDSIDPTNRAALLDAAFDRWRAVIEMKPNCDVNKWPFATADELEAAA